MRQVLVRYQRQGDLGDIQFLALDEAQEQVERALEYVERDSVSSDSSLLACLLYTSRCV